MKSPTIRKEASSDCPPLDKNSTRRKGQHSRAPREGKPVARAGPILYGTGLGVRHWSPRAGGWYRSQRLLFCPEPACVHGHPSGLVKSSNAALCLHPISFRILRSRRRQLLRYEWGFGETDGKNGFLTTLLKFMNEIPSWSFLKMYSDFLIALNCSFW